MAETYDPRAKKNIDSLEVNGVTLTVGDRVRDISGGPWNGRVGTLTKLKREWVSARQRARAGFSGKSAGYAETAFVLWDGTPTSGPYAYPQSCHPSGLEKVSED